MGNKSLLYIALSLAAFLGAVLYLQQTESVTLIDPENEQLVEMGKPLYYMHCASCHGKDRKGESPNWREFKADGTLPAPPHDETGHTWHHSDQLLFDYTKKGGAAIVPDGFKSAMPAFKGTLSDTEIRAILAFIKNRWPKHIQEKQALQNNQ